MLSNCMAATSLRYVNGGWPAAPPLTHRHFDRMESYIIRSRPCEELPFVPSLVHRNDCNALYRS